MTRGSDSDITYIGFLTGHGGDALQMLDLATGMARLGAHVDIVVPEVPESVVFAERCAAVGIPCVRSPLITATLSGRRQRLDRVVRLLRSVRTPLVHFHTGNTSLPRSVLIALDALRYRKSFVTLHGSYDTIRPGTTRARFWATAAQRRFEAVVSPSDHGTRFQLECGIADTVAVTIRNSVGLEAWRSRDSRGPRESLHMPAHAPLVVFGSRIDKQKRPLEAVRIFAGIADEFPDAVLAFVGSGTLEGEVAAEAARLGLADRVRLVGYQTNIADWLAASTVWLLPTEAENFSIAVLEALASGCAILSTSCQGNDEVLVDRQNALTFDVGDVDTAVIALRELLSDPALRERLGKGARETSEDYSIESMIESYRELYNRSPSSPAALRS